MVDFEAPSFVIPNMDAVIEEKFTLALWRRDGTSSECEITIPMTPPWWIRLKIKGQEDKEFHGADLFECLCQVRLALESANCLVLCNGARIDVYPSRMSREMGGGRKAYVLKMEKQTQHEDLIDIFDPAPKDLIAPVVTQRDYYDKWLKSLGR